MRKTAPYKIAIIGNGKLAKALVTGLLLVPGNKPEDIVVIMRVDSRSDTTFFDSLGVYTSTEMRAVSTIPSIILAVTPNASGNTLKRISKVGFSNKGEYEILSFVSGLTRSQIKSSINEVVNCRVIQATCNTNIAYGKGIICATGPSDVLSKLGKVYHEHPKRLLRSIVTVGSGNGFDTKAISMAYASCGTTKSLRGWLIPLLEVIKDHNNLNSLAEDEYSIVRKYIKNKVDVFRNNQFTYGKNSVPRARTTMISTIETLLAMDGDLDFRSLNKLYDTVVTSGGCTEKGIGFIKKSSDLIHLESLEKSFNLVFDGARTFKKTVRVSLGSLAWCI